MMPYFLFGGMALALLRERCSCEFWIQGPDLECRILDLVQNPAWRLDGVIGDPNREWIRQPKC